MPRGDQDINITGKDPYLKTIYNRLNKGDTRYNNTEVRLNRHNQNHNEIVVGMVYRLGSRIEIDKTNDDDWDQSA